MRQSPNRRRNSLSMGKWAPCVLTPSLPQMKSLSSSWEDNTVEGQLHLHLWIRGQGPHPLKGMGLSKPVLATGLSESNSETSLSQDRASGRLKATEHKRVNPVECQSGAEDA